MTETKNKQAIEPEVVTIKTFEQQDDLISIDAIVAQADRNAEVYNKIKGVVLKVTKPSDWVMMDDSPYLVGAGAERIAGLIGVNWSDVSSRKEWADDEKGKYYIYEYSGKFTFARRSIIAIGTCSQRDKFFSIGKSTDKDGKKVAVDKPSSEIDETNIMKAAYTNMVVNGVTRVLGIRALTKEDLESAKIQASSSFSYKKSEKDSVSTAEKRTDIWDYLVASHNNDIKAAAEHLQKITANPEKGYKGYTDITKLSEIGINIVYGKLKESIVEFKRGSSKEKPKEETPVVRESGQEG